MSRLCIIPLFKLLYRAIVFGLLLMLHAAPSVQAQSPALDSLRRLVQQTPSDTNRVLLLCQMSDQYWVLRVDSAAAYANQALALARRTGYRHGEGEALNRLGSVYRESNLAQALELFQQSLRLGEATHDLRLQAQNLRSIGIIYVYLRDRREGLSYYFRALCLGEKMHDEKRMVIELSNIGLAYDLYNEVDSSRIFQERAYQLARRIDTPTNYILYGLGQVARKQGRPTEALDFYRRSIRESKKLHHSRSTNFSCVGLATLYQQQGRLDSSIYYARLGYQAAQLNGFLRGVLNASLLLTQDFRTRGTVDSAFKYQGRVLAMKDTLFGQEKVMRLQGLSYREQQRAQQAIASQAMLKSRYQTYALLGGLAVLLLIVALLVRGRRQQHRANEALQASLAELKEAQLMLVQREKMAFLGELTAGVAHELQNPLGFVKQFAAASTGLVEEINGAQRLTHDGALDREILAGLKQNLQEISQHGQRATAIIKGMLEHARTGQAPRVSTDLNHLVQEYLCLAYDGVRQQDPQFTAQLTTHLEAAVPPVSVVAPDLGRAVLNLCTNALHAVRQRQKTADTSYQPQVTVSTQTQPDGAVAISIRDNGVGIPADEQTRIFEPFFTTKPMGEGTGLGLSLSHDIVKSHGGTLQVQSQEGEGTEFVLTLPAVPS
ncbi:tetratricopeptide repeat-containing sensor histidine kinase [Hymenobacter wooponensis]|uniref:histidine kinase n=1 Tax=Hymenobacter wooponensis TaxID=1525360 RepID=A0A4Z0MJC1_9BACT|nr:ATP-binding protein [Hymenobacter wooponensis]TGD79863.1 tetratricopeptide repeat protein [Hymenobacter wooponensis]